MKKFKKIAALLLAMVMALAMAVPAMAATSTTSPYNAKITVKGLSAQETTTVNFYAVVTYDATKQTWVVAEWAEDYVTEANGAYTVSDWTALKNAAPTNATYTQTAAEGVTSVSQEVPIGAYLILASGSKATYNVMGAETYKQDETYMTAEDVTVNAKTAGYTVDKSADDNFVAKGEEVTFTITTTFPTFETFAENGGTYVITDEVKAGLDLKEITSVTVDGTEVLTSVTTDIATDKQSATVTWSGIKDNTNAGKTVVVTIKATVTADTGYDNTANAKRDDESMGSDEEVGYSGDITITKKADDAVADDPDTEENEAKEATVLSGAQFIVKKLIPAVADDPDTEEDESADEYYVYLTFEKTATGVYKLTGTVNSENDATTIEATAGTVKVTGLDEGTYYFHETKAPDGYSINTTDTAVTISESNSSAQSVTGDMVDTKLSALPSTGGIGTTIFTVAGCMIMIAAGGMLIVSRRRKNA